VGGAEQGVGLHAVDVDGHRGLDDDPHLLEGLGARAVRGDAARHDRPQCGLFQRGLGHAALASGRALYLPWCGAVHILKCFGDEGAMPKRGETWIVRVDGERCSLCEICTRRCPRGRCASSATARRCACSSSPCCAAAAGATRPASWGAPSAPCAAPPAAAEDQAGGPVTLVEDELVRCSSCQRLFAPARKLRAVQRRRGQRAAVERCPACRRAQLVVRFIDDRSQAETAAAHRSARDILRRAGHWLDD